jgi:hypothetical protein
MNTNLTPGINTGKALNVKYLLTTLVVVVIVGFVLLKVLKPHITLYGSDGKESGHGEIKFSPPTVKK